MLKIYNLRAGDRLVNLNKIIIYTLCIIFCVSCSEPVTTDKQRTKEKYAPVLLGKVISYYHKNYNDPRMPKLSKIVKLYVNNNSTSSEKDIYSMMVNPWNKKNIYPEIDYVYLSEGMNNPNISGKNLSKIPFLIMKFECKDMNWRYENETVVVFHDGSHEKVKHSEYTSELDLYTKFIEN
jgi:hypothetical protein